MRKLTVDDVRALVERIRQMAGDDEAAHVAEDDLRDEVLSAIANGNCDDPAGCAREALTTSEIEFYRWCA